MSFLRKVWGYVEAASSHLYRLVLRYPLAAAATVALVVAAVALSFAGKNLQIGGLLQKLWGTKRPENARSTVVPARKDDTGRPIQPGQSDDKGFVQAPVSTKIVEPGIFSDPSVITVVHPDKGEVKIDLPVGVKNSDVHEVTEVSMDIYEVKNRDSGVDPKKLDGVLKKF